MLMAMVTPKNRKGPSVGPLRGSVVVFIVAARIARFYLRM